MIHPMGSEHRLPTFTVRACHTHPSSRERAGRALKRLRQGGSALVAVLLFPRLFRPVKKADVAMAAIRADICASTSREGIVSCGPVWLRGNFAATFCARFPMRAVGWSLLRPIDSGEPAPKAGDEVWRQHTERPTAPGSAAAASRADYNATRRRSPERRQAASSYSLKCAVTISAIAAHLPSLRV
jgi:hypothetical protein